MSRTCTRSGAAVVIIGVVAASAAACGGSDRKASANDKGETIELTRTDKGCDPAAGSVPAGTVTSNVKNGGTATVTELARSSARSRSRPAAACSPHGS